MIRISYVDKRIDEYINEHYRIRVLGLQFGAHYEDIVYLYESDSKGKTLANIEDISIRKYKQILWNKIKDARNFRL